MPMKLKVGKKYVLADDKIVKVIGTSFERPTMLIAMDEETNICYQFHDYGQHWFNTMFDVVAEWEKNDEDAVGN